MWVPHDYVWVPHDYAIKFDGIMVTFNIAVIDSIVIIVVVTVIGIVTLLYNQGCPPKGFYFRFDCYLNRVSRVWPFLPCFVHGMVYVAQP